MEKRETCHTLVLTFFTAMLPTITLNKALDARIVETTVEQTSNKKQKRKEIIYLKKPIRLERGTFYLIKTKEVHPNRFRNDFRLQNPVKLKKYLY